MPAANTLLPILALGALAFVSVAKTVVAGECDVTLAIVLEAGNAAGSDSHDGSALRR